MIKSRIVLIVVFLAVATPSIAASTAASTAEVSRPETPFSSRCTVSASSECNGAWTTLREEKTYLREIDSLSDRVTLFRYGTSGEGRPLTAVEIGDPSNPVLLMVCSQHGPEPAPRESCLRKTGELALSYGAEGGAEVRELLSKLRVVFVPTANPDGRFHNHRGLTDDADPNRHHADLLYPENRGIAELFEKYEPIAAMDTHEMDPGFSFDIALSEPKNPDVDPVIRDTSLDIMNALARHFADESSFSTGEYEIEKITPQVLGNQIALRFAVGGLVETRMDRPRAVRVWMQDESFDVVASYVADHRAEIEQVTSEARRRAAALGAEPPLAAAPAPEVRVPEARAPEARAPEVRAPEVPAPEAPLPAAPEPTERDSSTDPQPIAPSPTPSEGASPKIEVRDSASSLALLLILILACVAILALGAVLILRRYSNRSP